MGRIRAIAAAFAMCLFAGITHAAQWQMPEIRFPQATAQPIIAATPQELARLKAAYAQTGPAHDAVARLVTAADAAITKEPAFPPRGGQHNQWYQCEACQMGLRTIDDTHHQCPKCRKIYSGEPYDDVIFARIHSSNLHNANTAAWAYAITGKRAYAEYAARILLGYAQRYREYPLHSNDRRQGDKAGRSGGHINEQTLGEASMMATQIAPAYDLISTVLSAQDRAAIRDGLIVPMLTTIDRNKAGKSNWQTWHNAAMIWGGAVIADESWVRKAIADPRNGFVYQMNVSVTSDGMWYENSWGYHFYTLSALVHMAEGSRRLGIDLWSHPMLRKMCTLAPRYAMADGSLPRFGDDVQSSVRGGALMECAYHAYNDPAIAGLLSDRPSWDSILLGRKIEASSRSQARGSEVFSGAGHAILRTDGPAGLTAALTFGPYGGFHGHFDKLSFVFFGRGQELGVDPGRAASQAYRLPIHTRWYKATLGHNAVLVDGASQAPAEGKLELFAATATHAAAVATCDAAYPGVRHRRMLCMTPSYLLVLDDLNSDRERQFDWLYHNRGSAAQCPAADAAANAEDKFTGQEYINGMRAGTSDKPVRVEFSGRGVTTYLTTAPHRATQVRLGDGVGASVMDRVPMVMVRRTGRSALFAAVIEPVAAGGRPEVTDLAAERTPNGIRVTIQAGTAADEIVLSADGGLKMSRAGRELLSARPITTKTQ